MEHALEGLEVMHNLQRCQDSRLVDAMERQVDVRVISSRGH
jgi:hypothetical protein